MEYNCSVILYYIRMMLFSHYLVCVAGCDIEIIRILCMLSYSNICNMHIIYTTVQYDPGG